MVYDWTAGSIKADCFRLYVEERKSLEKVMQHMKDAHNFNAR